MRTKWKPTLFAHLVGLTSWPLNPIFIQLTNEVSLEAGVLLAAVRNHIADLSKKELIYLRDRELREFMGVKQPTLLKAIRDLKSFDFVAVDRIKSEKKTRFRFDLKKLMRALRRIERES